MPTVQDDYARRPTSTQERASQVIPPRGNGYLKMPFKMVGEEDVKTENPSALGVTEGEGRFSRVSK